MVWHLPPDSAVYREMSGGWTTSDELLAVNAEISYASYRTALAAGGIKKHRLPKPLQIPRPSPAQTPAEDDTGVSPRPAHHRHRRQATTIQDVVAVLAHGFGPRG